MWIAKVKNKTHISLRFSEKFNLKGQKVHKNESFFIFRGVILAFLSILFSFF